MKILIMCILLSGCSLADLAGAAPEYFMYKHKVSGDIIYCYNKQEEPLEEWDLRAEGRGVLPDVRFCALN